jgi:lipopolysaccharide transport system permease protein
MLGFEKKDIRLIHNLWLINIDDRYLGSNLGRLWAILNPLIMFSLFTFVFGYVFKARLPGIESTMGYSIWLICGYGPWLATTDGLIASANSIVGNSAIVKNMSFKTETIPVASVLIGIVPLFVSLIFLIILKLFSGNPLSLNISFLPIVIIIQFIFLISLGILLSAITTFMKDFGILLPNLLLIILFATPIFYPIEAVPAVIGKITMFNPFYILADAYRQLLIYNSIPNLVNLLFLGIFSFILLIINLGLFRRVKSYFPMMI